MINSKIDITIGTIALVDQFEWDIDYENNCPESFAKGLCSDLEIPREFEAAISHQIREQIFIACKTLIILDYPIEDKYFVQPVINDPELASYFLPQVHPIESKLYSTTLRNNVQDKYRNGPMILLYTYDELDRIEKDKERESRYDYE